MKKFISVLSLTFGLLVSVTAFIACGSDDDSAELISSKRISKIIGEEDDYKYESTYQYDSHGRVIKVMKTETSATEVSFSEITYQYGESEIITKEVEGLWSESHTYTLKNGLIIKDVEVQTTCNNHPSTTTTSYSYDNNGYMSSMTYLDDDIGSGVLNLKWTNGNLTDLDDRKFTYTNIPWPKGMFFYFRGSNMDPNLWAAGFWGKTPKNMPYQYLNYDWTYKYETSNGLITKISVVDNETDIINVCTIYWE